MSIPPVPDGARPRPSVHQEVPHDRPHSEPAEVEAVAHRPPLLAARLRLESLEGRDNPAYYWDPLSGGNLLATNPLNWTKDGSGGSMVRCTSVEVPTNPTDNLVFGAYIPQTTLYQYGQQPQTIPAHWSTADCILTQQYSNGVANFRGLTLLSTYPGEVDLRQSANVESLDLRAGKIKQNDTNSLPSSAGTITVTQGLFWSGGTLNSNTVAGFVNLAPGANGTAAPTDGGTVNLGSTFTLLGGATLGSLLDVYNGTYNLNQGDGFIVEKNSRLTNAPVPKGLGKPLDGAIIYNGNPTKPDSEGFLRVRAGGLGEFKPVARPSGNTNRAEVIFKGVNPSVMNNGRVEMTDWVDISFTIDDPNNANNKGMGNGYGQYQSAGEDPPVTKIEAGCFVTLNQKTDMRIGDGRVELAERRDGSGNPEPGNQPDITVTAQNATYALTLEKGVLLRRADETPKMPLTLNIVGGTSSLNCAGEIHMCSMKSVVKNDTITTNKQINFTEDTKIKMFWFDADKNAALPPMPVAWTLIESTYDLAGDAINMDPNFIAPPVGVAEEILLARHGVKKGQLKATRTK